VQFNGPLRKQRGNKSRTDGVVKYLIFEDETPPALINDPRELRAILNDNYLKRKFKDAVRFAEASAPRAIAPSVVRNVRYMTVRVIFVQKREKSTERERRSRILGHSISQ